MSGPVLYAPRGPWIVVYDANGIPFWTIPQWGLPFRKEAPPVTKSSESEDGKGSYRISVGNWDEIYDTVDGTKTWYNKKTRKTTKKDPFW